MPEVKIFNEIHKKFKPNDFKADVFQLCLPDWTYENFLQSLTYKEPGGHLELQITSYPDEKTSRAHLTQFLYDNGKIVNSYTVANVPDLRLISVDIQKMNSIIGLYAADGTCLFTRGYKNDLPVYRLALFIGRDRDMLPYWSDFLTGSERNKPRSYSEFRLPISH